MSLVVLQSKGLMFLAQLTLEVRVLFAKRINLVQQVLILHSVELGKDSLCVGVRTIAKRQRIAVHGVHQRVGLLAIAKLVLITHLHNALLGLAAAIADLLAHIPTAAFNGSANVAKLSLHLVNAEAQRLAQLTDSIAVALDGLHQQFATGIAIQFGWQTATKAITKTTKTAVATKSTHHKDEENPDPPTACAAPCVLIVLTVHQGSSQIRIHLITVHKTGNHGENTIQSSGAFSLGNINNSFTHNCNVFMVSRQRDYLLAPTKVRTNCGTNGAIVGRQQDSCEC